MKTRKIEPKSGRTKENWTKCALATVKVFEVDSGLFARIEGLVFAERTKDPRLSYTA